MRISKGETTSWREDSGSAAPKKAERCTTGAKGHAGCIPTPWKSNTMPETYKQCENFLTITNLFFQKIHSLQYISFLWTKLLKFPRNSDGQPDCQSGMWDYFHSLLADLNAFSFQRVHYPYNSVLKQHKFMCYILKSSLKSYQTNNGSSIKVCSVRPF